MFFEFHMVMMLMMQLYNEGGASKSKDEVLKTFTMEAVMGK